MSTSASSSPSPLVQAAEALARAHHANYDPSHDIHHIQRVRLLALSIARSLSPPSSSPSSPPVDLLVVELAALCHDLLDAKYLPRGGSTAAADVLRPLWDLHGEGEGFGRDRQELVERVVENVSYSKEVKRVREGRQTPWHEECRELHCVHDADKLDAIGAFGILRCAAYSSHANRALYLPPPASNLALAPGAPAPEGNDSAIQHFHDKLFKLEGMMRTEKGRELARKRTESMRRFVEDVEREWAEAVGEV
ncbi:hypothetical protein JCM10213_005044 [Rhodosporidiobolus nylandii]